MKLLKKLYSIHSKSGKEQKMIKFLLWWIRNNVPGARVDIDKEIGNIYVTKGVSDTYPCLVAHIDQVQSIHSRDFQAIETKDIIFGYSPKNKRLEGLGADDKNGVWVSLKSLLRFDVLKVAFFVGEEIGCVGSSKADMDFFKDVRFVIQCDRRGSSDLITSICSTEISSKEFIEATGYEAFGYHLEEGMMTDVLTLKENGLQVSAVNMSCGYFEAHTDHEFTIKKDLLNCLSFVDTIIKNCTGVYDHQCDYSMGLYDDYFYYDQYYDELYELLQTYPDLTFGEVEAAYQQHNPRLDHSELKQTYEIVKADLDFWRKEEEYYARHY
jgi:hypothetical protein